MVKFNYSHRVIIVLLSTAAFVHNIVMNGAMNVIMSSLQKEFYLNSKDTGIYISVYDIGSLISSLIIPILGARGSKPKWIAFGMCMLAIGCTINVSPHFLRPRKHTLMYAHDRNHSDNVYEESTSMELCDISTFQYLPNQFTTVQMKSYQNESAKDVEYRPVAAANTQSNDAVLSDSSSDDSSFRYNNLKYVLYASNIVNGLSSASMTTLAFSYIEDIAPTELSSIYESIYYATGAFGMGVGFMITSQFLKIHTDIDYVQNLPSWFTPHHPNWIGAWWLPFIIFGGIAFIFALVICTFPKHMGKHGHESGEHHHHQQQQSQGGTLRDTDNTKKQQPHSVIYKANGNSNTLSVGGGDAQKTPDMASTSITVSDGEAMSDDDETNPFNTTETLAFQSNLSDNEQSPKLNPSSAHNQQHLQPEQQQQQQHSTLSQSTFLNAVKETGSILSLNSKPYYYSTNDNKMKRKRHKFSHMIKSALLLLKNPIFCCILIAAAIEGLLQNSFLAFASLFLEFEYRLASGDASLVLGALSIPPLIMGSLLSGYLIKRFNWQIRSLLVFLIFSLFANLCLYGLLFIHCKEPNIILAKNEEAYHTMMSTMSTTTTATTTNGTTTPFQIQTTVDCLKQTMSQCYCSDNIYKPLCLEDSNDVVFQSACIAGCQSFDNSTGSYSSCTHAKCIIENDLINNEAKSGGRDKIRLTDGICARPSTCLFKLVSAYVTIFFIMFFTAFSFIPYMKVTFACVSKPEMNAIALGIKQLAMTGIGTIPGPIIFGAVIDTTCRFWFTDDLNQKVCKIYDNRLFAYSFSSLGVGFKSICWLSVIFAFVFLKKNKKYGQQQQQQQQQQQPVNKLEEQQLNNCDKS